MVQPAVSRSEPTRVPARARPVEERHASDLPFERFFREFVEPRRPVLIHGGVANWPALARWTPEYFKARFPNKRVNVSYEATMTFAEFVDAVLVSTPERPGPYMYRLFLHEHLPDVLADLVPQNPYGFPGRYASALMLPYYRRPDGFLKLLFSGPGGRFPVMHHDLDESHAAITEIYGDKEFVLYAPSDGPYLYPTPARANHSLVDNPHEQDLERFPLLAKATQYRTVLKPGDTIFVPYGWWHTARALTVSISVCQNMVYARDWDGFVESTTPFGARGPFSKQGVKRAYLKVADPMMSALEWVQRFYPRTAKSLRIPGLVCPLSSDFVPHDPGTRPLKIQFPTG